MKTTISLFLCLLIFQKVSALSIAQVSISGVPEKILRVDISTEAVELYYFDSWQYTITDNTITVEALFVAGFGSTITYLNNHFEIPLDLDKPDIYRLIVKAYYTSYRPENLQDTSESAFSTPFTGTITLLDTTLNTLNFINPSSGELSVNPKIRHIWLFDSHGKFIGNFSIRNGKIPLHHYADGIYIIGYFELQQYKTFRFVLKKQ